MNPLLFAILFYILAYGLDLSTALLMRHFKPNLFAANEDNKKFIAYLNKYGTWSGVWRYEATNHFIYLFLFFAVILIYNQYWGDNSSWIASAIMTFRIKGLFHSFGMATNVVGLVAQKELKNRSI